MRDLEVAVKTCAHCTSSDIVLQINQIKPQRQRTMLPERMLEGVLTCDELVKFVQAARQ